MSRKAFPVVLSAPSGTGKTTLANLLIDSVSNLQLSVSYTTRPIRGNERDNIDYHFVSRDKFEEMINQGEFLEYATVYDNLYGSSKTWTENALGQERDVVFDIDVHGGLQIKTHYPRAVLIYILPPSLEELEERLRQRGTDSEELIQKRMKAARDEILIGLEKYDYVINNEKLDRALFDLTAIIRAHRLTGFDREKIRKRLLGE